MDHEILRDLQQAAAQIPRRDQVAESVPLQQRYERSRRSRRPGPQAIGEILVAVLARLGVNRLESEGEAPSPDATGSDPRFR